MKKKLIILTLCFTIIISSINFKKVDAMDFVISPAIAAVVITLGVGAGLILNSESDIKTLANEFYQYHKKNWELVETAFKATVAFESNRITSIKDGSFLDYCEDFFTNTYSDTDVDNIYSSSGFFPVYPAYAFNSYLPIVGSSVSFEYSNLKCTISLTEYDSTINTIRFDYSYLDFYGNWNTSYSTRNIKKSDLYESIRIFYNSVTPFYLDYELYNSSDYTVGSFRLQDWTHDGDVIALPGSKSFDWEKNIESNKDKEGTLGLYVPGNVGSLVGVNGGTIVGEGVLNPAYDLPLDGAISVPGVGEGVLEGVNTGTGEDTGTDIIFPNFPSYGDSLDFSPLYATGITDKFPFSLPWDFGRLLDCFNLEPTAPVFEFPIVSETITIDLSQFDEWANIVRFFVFIGFLFVLIYASKFFRT